MFSRGGLLVVSSGEKDGCSVLPTRAVAGAGAGVGANDCGNGSAGSRLVDILPPREK
jgi:hypothetical protein